MSELEGLAQLFDHLAEPVVFQSDGVIRYENPAAAGLLRSGDTEELRAALDGKADSAAVDGRRYCVRRSSWGSGTLAVLQAELAETGLHDRLPQLMENLRHQINNLMAVAHLVKPVIREQGGGKYGDYLAIMDQSFYRLMRLIQNMGLAEDITAGRLKLHDRAVDLAALCGGLMLQLEQLAAMSGVSLSWESEEAALLSLGDETLLRQMLLELLSNALRGAGRGGRAGLRLSKSGGRALLTVWNSGAEIDLLALDEGGSCCSEGGMGLGLALARQIAALHGGTIVLEPRAGEGTQAVVSLPIRPPRPGMVYTPQGERGGGFSPVLVGLASVLPYEAFRPEELE